VLREENRSTTAVILTEASSVAEEKVGFLLPLAGRAAVEGSAVRVKCGPQESVSNFKLCVTLRLRDCSGTKEELIVQSGTKIC